MTAVSNREPPEGYTEEWDDTVWNIGFVFLLKSIQCDDNEAHDALDILSQFVRAALEENS